MPEENAVQITLSPEQSLFIGKALMGDNILVDACIGSGKRRRLSAFAVNGQKSSTCFT